jgi:hypothetical protein
MKKCFVMSPIGPEGSAVREHADDVYDYIIRPAMEECGIEAFRSDHLREPGRISEQMFHEILNDDLCIAVLTGHNPNVFYELAIAQAAGRPVLALLEKGQNLPFDVLDLRCVYYDLKPRMLFEKVYTSEIIQHVKSVEAAGWKANSPFNLLTSVGGGDDRFRFLDESREYGSTDVWLQLLEKTEHVYEIMGMNRSSCRSRGYSELLASKAKGGCKVRVLLMHPDNPSLRQLINDTVPENDYDDTIREISRMLDYFSAIAKQVPGLEVRQIRRGCLDFQLTRSDHVAVANQYLFSQRPAYSPLWECAAGSHLYQIMAAEFEALWRANEANGASQEHAA